MEIIGYGVAGCGYFGAEPSHIMNTKPGAAVRAVYDPDHGTEAAEELGCEAEEHSIATADACTRSLSGNRKVRRSEII